ncbi:hypothetical protein CEXT_335421 [Caerostris extrusa]|uniref:Uncharacterized protein n=1 Tax=Caerostris extrusa TaxID=172846 RepID=A0AAV4XNG5_CAEEX|nr:hypothetical protein CEXT_335421 [Caerostris extrusa]
MLFYSGKLRFNVRVKGTGVSILSIILYMERGGIQPRRRPGGMLAGNICVDGNQPFEDLYNSTVKLAFKMRNRSKRLAENFISPILRQEGRREGWIDGWKYGRIDGWKNRWIDGRKEGWMNEWMDGWDEWMDEWKEGTKVDR